MSQNTHKRFKVAFVGGDQISWALDEDLKNIKRCTGQFATETSLHEAEIIHLCNWYHAFTIPQEFLDSKIVICNVTGEPRRLLGRPDFHRLFPIVDFWVTHSHQARDQWLKLIGLSVRIPYSVDQTVFFPIEDHDELLSIRRNLGIDNSSFIISNFNRDSLGSNLNEPKTIKGPDIFLEIARQTKMAGLKQCHFLLAGPRRHWLRDQFRYYNIPYTFVGREINSDDIEENTLTRTRLNELYNISDLNIVSSRSEGGPHAILEALSSKCKIISRRVGVAEDLLSEESLYDHPHEAIKLIRNKIFANKSVNEDQKQYEKLRNECSDDKIARHYYDLYSTAKKMTSKCNPPFKITAKHEHEDNSFVKLIKRLKLSHIFRRKKSVVLWHKFKKPPWGGGNQFLLALADFLKDQNFKILTNRVLKHTTVTICNSVTFDLNSFERQISDKPGLIIHRVDGPYKAIRGKNQGLDDAVSRFNRDYADISIVQSVWSAGALKDQGILLKNPILIPNSVNPKIFYKSPPKKISQTEKIKLISTSWSGNKNKGGEIYKKIDDSLDRNRFELIFVGNCSEKLDYATLLPPVNSEDLAKILRECHIYITASKNDPCSNSLIEAMSCGLPVLYLDEGGHPELVQAGGMPFTDINSFKVALDELVKHYDSFQNLLTPPTANEVMKCYQEIIESYLR
jgi:glycosyltransferase involved in cell wall biosynthesis